MTPEQLRSSILQYAIEGKLVEQRPEEGTAEELYQQIQEEKKRLITEGKIKKEKALPKITEDEIPFDIPDSWKWVNLGNIVSVYGGKRIPAGRKLSDEVTEYKYIRVSDMKNETVDLNNIKYVPEDIYPKIKNYTIGKNDVYITVAGTIGRIGIIPQELDGANLTENADKLILYAGLNQKWICKSLMSQYIQYQIKEVTTKVGQPKLALKRIRDLQIPLPPLEEQKRIVAKIEELEPFIEKYEKAWNELEALNKKFPGDMKNSILQYAIEGKLVEQRPEEGTAEELYQQIQEEKQKLVKEGKIKKEKALPEITEDEIPFDIPDNWKWSRWGEISLRIQYGYNAPAKDSGNVKMLRISDIKDSKVFWDNVPYCEIDDKETSQYILNDNDILFARTGGTVGKSYLVKDVPNNVVFAGYLIRTDYSKKLLPQYLKYFMETKLYWKQLRNGTIATAQPNCNGKTLSKMIIPLPPLEEQKRIVAKIEELLPLCESLEK